MKRLPTMLLTGIFLLAGNMNAQYLDTREYELTEARYLAVGFVTRDFAPRASNVLSDSLSIRFNRIMPMISYSQGPAEFYFGYARYQLAGNSKTTILFGGRYGTEAPLVGHRHNVLALPIQLAADYTKAEGLGPSRETFNIASVGLGLGLKYRYVTPGIDLSISAMEFAQYSSEGFSVGTGFSAATMGDAVLQIRDVGILEGIAVGYRFRLQTWAMSEARFNYRSLSHGPYLGILF
jgi:hypothetical protein